MFISIFLDFRITLTQYIVSERILIFLGYEDFVDIFWGSSQNWTSFRGHFSMYFKVFS